MAVNGRNNTSLDGPLTAREREVIADLLLGHTNQEIADSLGISIETVKRHFYNIFAKCGVDNRVALAMAATEGKL